MPTAKRVAIYARVSTQSQTVENQLTELREIATRYEWNVIVELVEKGVSGSKGRALRPVLTTSFAGPLDVRSTS